MFYIFHGTNIETSAKKAHSLLDSLRAKKPDAAFVSIDADNWNLSAVEEHVGGQGLFSGKYIVFLDRISENAEAREQIAGLIQGLGESANIFIALEGKLNAELKKVFEKYAEKSVVSGKEKESTYSKASSFNIFSLADALGARDAFRAWSIYREAIDGGIEAENILGTLFWQAKSIILAARTKNAAEAGLSPFVYSKAKRCAANYSDLESRKLLGKLVTLYHDGHRGAADLELGIERVLLSITRRAHSSAR